MTPTTTPTPATADGATKGIKFVTPLGPEDLGKSDDFKKRRGPGSCAECRRLKLKCDRRLPCSSCTKRGCAAVCPNGTLAAGPGKRFFLADTQHLHEKIWQMGQRIAELEDALAELQAQVSHEKHPLLREKLLIINAPVSTVNATSSLKGTSDGVAALLGTLTIGDRANFVGPAADSDHLLEDSAPDPAGASCALPLEILLMANTFPFTTVHLMQQSIMQRLSEFVPPATDAWQLSELYYEKSTWMFNLIPKQEFIETIFSVIYAGEAPSAAGVTPHDLGVMFMVFAIACITDLSRPPYNAEAANYYQLARVAIGIDSPIDHPTLQAVRAIHMMSRFVQMCDHPNGATTCYNLLGLNSQLCQALGLHRTDTQWNISTSEREKRRSVFWDVVGFDAYISLSLGRPPCFSTVHVDVQLPEDSEMGDDSDGDKQQSFRGRWHPFTRDILLKVMDETSGVAPLPYATVLRLDRLVREHRFSETLQFTDSSKQGISETLALQRAFAFVMTQKLLLYLHRSFFAYAINETAEDPLKSQYAQSVLAAFRGAVYITSSARALYKRIPLSVRLWMFWSHAFSAAIILGGIVIRSPSCGIAPAAWLELDHVYNLFEQLGSASRRIARVLPKMRKLHTSAKEAYESFATAQGGPRDPPSPHEFLYFLGVTRVVDSSRATSPQIDSQSSPGSQRPGSSNSTPAMPFEVNAPLAPAPPAPLQTDFNEFLATLHPLGPPQPGQQLQTQPPQMQSQAPALQQWSLENWMASSAPFPTDGSFPPFNDDVAMGDANGRSTSTLPATNWALPPVWGDQSLDAAEGLLPGDNWHESWQRFMDGIGMMDDAPVEQQA